jgi:hypothetical protein
MEKYLIVDEDTWKEIPSERREYMMYQNLLEVNRRLDKLEHTNFVKSLWAFAGGAIGGFIATIGLKKW